MSKFAAFDESIKQQIANGFNTASKLDSHASGLRDLAEPLRKKDPWGGLSPIYRVIDRRLQSMRKSGEIRFNGKIWELTKP